MVRGPVGWLAQKHSLLGGEGKEWRWSAEGGVNSKQQSIFDSGEVKKMARQEGR